MQLADLIRRDFYPLIFSSLLWGLILVTSCAPTVDRSPKGFFIQEGYTMSLVASEPLIKDPVDLEFDEHGDAYVLEMPGYPYEDSKSRIIYLHDQDADGIYDESEEFAIDLELGSSIVPYDKGFLVAAPPYLLFLKDVDGDHIADLRDTLMGGFSTGNLQHNYNGLTYGLDGWIYAANGGNSGEPFWWGDPSSKVQLTGDDFRIHLTQKKIEKIGPSSGGFELGIDEWGEVFGTHNLDHVNQIAYPRGYGKLQGQPSDITLVNISNHDENGLARIYPIGEQESRVNHPEQSGYFSGACGITYYDNGALGSELENSLWVTDVVLNLIHVDRLSNNQSVKEASRIYDRSEFVASSDRSFRPVNSTLGPDGAMYIVDMYRKVIEHPEWIPDEIEKDLDLNAGKDKGRIYKVTSSGRSHQDEDLLSKMNSPSEVVSLLSHPNQWVRNTAHRLIAGDKENWNVANHKVYALLSSDDEVAKYHALHLLNIYNELSPDIILTQIDDANPTYRKSVIQFAEEYISTDERVLHDVLKALGDSEVIPRMQAALSLSKLDVDAKENVEKSIIEGVIAALQLENDFWSLQALALASKGFESDIFKILSRDPSGSSTSEFISLITQSSLADIAQVEKILLDLSKDAISQDLKYNVIQSLAANITSIEPSIGLRTAVKTLQADEDIPLLGAIQELRSHLGLSPSKEFLASVNKAEQYILDADKPVEERVSWLNLLNTRPFAFKYSILSGLLDHNQPEKLQSLALTQLWNSDDPAVGEMLVSKWGTMSPGSRRTASDILLYKELHHDALLTGLENNEINIGEMNFDLERRRTLLWWTDNEQTKSRARDLFSDAGVVTRDSVISDMKASLSLEGNMENGGEVFDQLCGQCHIYGTQGYEVGPALTEISRKSKESLLYDILDPNAAVDSKYINHKVTLKDGQIHLGVIYSEDDTSISIRKMAGVSVEVDKENIAEFRSLGTSFMMEGLEANLDHQSMADLLSFLQKG